jgi:hypothetical protein
MGFAEVLVLILLVLKLTGVIAVSWWIVVLPMIVAYSLVLIGLAMVTVAGVLNGR